MPLNLSAAHSSRVTKNSKTRNPLLKRSSSSPFTDLHRRKPAQRSKSKPESSLDEDFFEERLEDVGQVKSLATELTLRDVAQTIQYVQGHMFDNIPENGGFNSTRISEILNFRRNLPPTVAVTHVHAMIPSPTSTEREISELTRAGIVRRLVIPGRGSAGSNAGDGLALFKDIASRVRKAEGLDAVLVDKFLRNLEENPTAQSLHTGLYIETEITSLMRAGFLTSISGLNASATVFSQPYVLSSDNSTTIANISKSASGSLAAVGGETAIHDAGGHAGQRRSSSQYDNISKLTGSVAELQLSLPGMGPYLRLLTTARSHFISLITRSRFHEMPLYLLRERWEGGISTDNPRAKAKWSRGEFAGILPARTRKWKQFNGLSFEWVLAECLGAGLVELFETGSVGQAARIP